MSEAVCQVRDNRLWPKFEDSIFQQPVSINSRTMAPKGRATDDGAEGAGNLARAGLNRAVRLHAPARWSGHEVLNLFAYRFVDTLCGLFPSAWKTNILVVGWADTPSASASSTAMVDFADVPTWRLLFLRHRR